MRRLTPTKDIVRNNDDSQDAIPRKLKTNQLSLVVVLVHYQSKRDRNEFIGHSKGFVIIEMARIRSPSASQAATVPVRILSLFTLLLLFLGTFYIFFVYMGSYGTVKTPNIMNVHSQQQSHGRSTPNVLHDHQNSKNRIVLENMKQGTPRSVWWTNQTAGEPVIEGFTNEFSYLPGEEVQFKLHSEELLLRSSVARYVHPEDPLQVTIHRCCRRCCLFHNSNTIVRSTYSLCRCGSFVWAITMPVVLSSLAKCPIPGTIPSIPTPMFACLLACPHHDSDTPLLTQISPSQHHYRYKSHRQPPCLHEPSSRLVDCDHWTVSAQVPLPTHLSISPSVICTVVKHLQCIYVIIVSALDGSPNGYKFITTHSPTHPLIHHHHTTQTLPLFLLPFLFYSLGSTQWAVPVTAISGVYVALPVYRLSGSRRARKYHHQSALKSNATASTIVAAAAGGGGTATAMTPSLSHGTRDDEWVKGSYIPFVVRDTYISPPKAPVSASSPAATTTPNPGTSTSPGPGTSPFPVPVPQYRGSDVLFKTADTTWVAYNKYGTHTLLYTLSYTLSCTLTYTLSNTLSFSRLCPLILPHIIHINLHHKSS